MRRQDNPTTSSATGNIKPEQKEKKQENTHMSLLCLSKRIREAKSNVR